MKKVFKAAVDNKKNYKTFEETRELIKEFFKSKGETLTKDELERTVTTYIYLTDDRIPICAAIMRKRSE